MHERVAAGTVMMRPAYGTRMKPPIAPNGTVLPSGAVMVDYRGRKIRSGYGYVVMAIPSSPRQFG